MDLIIDKTITRHKRLDECVSLLSVWACKVLWWWPGWCLSWGGQGGDKTQHKSAQQGDNSTVPQIIPGIRGCPSPGEEFWERCQIPDTAIESKRGKDQQCHCGLFPSASSFCLFFGSTWIYRFAIFSPPYWSFFPLNFTRNEIIAQEGEHFRKFNMSHI